MIPGENGPDKVHIVFQKSVPYRTNSKKFPRGHFVTLDTPHAISSEESHLSAVRLGFSRRSYADPRRCVTLVNVRDIIGRSCSVRGGV